MVAHKAASVPVAPRRTLLEWIETDDGNANDLQPACSARLQALHAAIAALDPAGQRLQPPPGLRLAPLG